MSKTHKHLVAKLRDAAHDYMYWRGKDKCVWCERPRKFVTDKGVEWGCGSTAVGATVTRTAECHQGQDKLWPARYASLPF
jgi:hypothetical protein